VVATDIPGTRDLVVPGETGYLVAVGDRAGVTRHTNRLLDDAALAARLGAAGRQRAQSEFSVATMVERYVELYRGLL
jgi:glycosyltransferase involved in cell wall biosynthesis